MRAFLVATLALVASVVTPALSTPLGYGLVPLKLVMPTDLFVEFATNITSFHVNQLWNLALSATIIVTAFASHYDHPSYSPLSLLECSRFDVHQEKSKC
jgi:hypothetical protein